MKSAFLTSLFIASSQIMASEVFEAANGREKELPAGKEADGIRGDFVLRNDKVEAVISCNAPLRRANMSTFYGPNGVTPGCLYDLTLRGAANDQLVIFAPGGHGEVSYVRAIPDEKGAAVEVVKTAAKNEGVFMRNEYLAKDGLQGLMITTTFRNETEKPLNVSSKPEITRFEKSGITADGIHWFDAINPAHKCGYAYGTLQHDGPGAKAESLTLSPRQEIVITRFFAVGTSPAAAVAAVRAARGESGVTVTGRLVDSQGRGVSTAVITLREEKKGLSPKGDGAQVSAVAPSPGGKVQEPSKTGGANSPDGSGSSQPQTREVKPSGSSPTGDDISGVPAYPDADGAFNLRMPQGESFEAVISDIGRPSITRTFSAKSPTGNIQLSDASRIRFQISDEAGRPIPCKAHFQPLEPSAPKLNLGPKWRAHGCVDQYHSANGHFTQQLPPGSYLVTVVRGPEYGHLKKEITLEPGKEAVFEGVLKRQVDTRGWISSDFHNHSTPSGDNVCDTDGRLINLAAEHIEFAPTTEHNRLYDWEPLLKQLGLDRHVKTVKGVELTGSRQHFNAFPFEPDPMLQDGGAPVWNDDPRITALTLRRWQGERADRYIQFNHPDLSNMFVDRDGDGVRDGGFIGVGSMIDGSETQNGPGTDILAEAPYRISRAPGAIAAKATLVREFVWRQLLNQGLRITAVGVADAHSVYGNGVGCWRGYIPSSTDDPEKINWSELSPRVKKGNVVLTTGPFLEVTTQNGKIAGDDDRATGGIDLKVRVQCADWLDIDRVQVLVNSLPDSNLNFTRTSHPQMFQNGVVKFEQTLHVHLQADAHIIVVAVNEGGDLKICYGSSDYAKMRACAYNNPIFVDVDGGGFAPNGHTLGYELPVMGMSADSVRDLMKSSGSVVK